MIWQDILDGVRAWRAEDRPFALATVVRVRGSAPRPVGTAMAVSTDGLVLGSVSGGCVEADVFERAAGVIAAGRAEVVHYGIGDGDAFSVGLTCGGELDVLLEPVDEAHFPEFDQVLERIGRELPTALATWIDHAEGPTHLVLGRSDGREPSALLDADRTVERRLRALLGTSSAELLETCTEDGVLVQRPVLLQSFAPPPRMIVFGAVEFAAALSRIGSFLGYRVTVCDARPVFATPARFPYAEEVVVDWPHRYLETQEVDPSTVLCVLTHDPKFDVPLLQVALRTSAGYIGVMGSRRSHDDRVRRLQEAGVRPAELARMRSPIGLDLGARTVEETAVSIAAEIVASTQGRSGLPLSEVDVPIHAVPLTVADRRRA